VSRPTEPVTRGKINARVNAWRRSCAPAAQLRELV